jgi:hypothetical protein
MIWEKAESREQKAVNYLGVRGRRRERAESRERKAVKVSKVEISPLGDSHCFLLSAFCSLLSSLHAVAGT